MKIQATEWENIFVIHLSNKDSQPEYIKILKNQWKNRKMAKQALHQRGYPTTNKHMKKSSILLFIKEMQIKNKMPLHIHQKG